MNKIVEDQLKKVKVAQLPPYDETTLHLSIPKVNTVVNTEFVVGAYYIIQLDDYLIKPYEGFTLHDNWNKGVAPKHNCLRVMVLQTMGKMIKFRTIAYDYETKNDYRS